MPHGFTLFVRVRPCGGFLGSGAGGPCCIVCSMVCLMLVNVLLLEHRLATEAEESV